MSLTCLRDCWACGTGMDLDQKPPKCLACGADNPCGDGPGTKRQLPSKAMTSGQRETHVRWLTALLEYYSGEEISLRKRLDEREVWGDGHENEWRRYQAESSALRAAIEALQSSHETCDQLVRSWHEAIKSMETSDMDAKLTAQRRVVDFERKLMSWAASHSEKASEQRGPYCPQTHQPCERMCQSTCNRLADCEHEFVAAGPLSETDPRCIKCHRRWSTLSEGE